MMRCTFLLTGFNNWGKTWLIKKLFGRGRFYKDALYDYSGSPFCVLPQSNDDLGKVGYENEYYERMKRLAAAGRKAEYIFSAFCPTKEIWNQSIEIIGNLYSNDRIFLIPIEYKWCCHAKLQLNEIEDYYSSITQLSIHSLKETDPEAKLRELQTVIKVCLNNHN